VLKGHHSFSTRGDRDQLSVLCIVALSVACYLSGSLMREKGDTVLFEDSSLWDVANIVRVEGPTRNPSVL
jgi:hypothetical protein